MCKPTPAQALWLRQQCDTFLHAWKGQLREFNILKSRKKIIKEQAVPLGVSRNCDKLETIVENQKNKSKSTRRKKCITNPFADGYESEDKKNEEFSVYMADSNKQETIALQDIEDTWLWKRFVTYRTISCSEEKQSRPRLFDREALKFYAGAGISTVGASMVGFDTAALVVSKIGLLFGGLSLLPSLIISLLVVRAGYHAIVNGATKDVMACMDSDLQKLREASDERRLADHVHLVFDSLYQAKVSTVLQHELDDKTIDGSLHKLNDRVAAWSRVNESNQKKLAAVQCDIKARAAAEKAEIFTQAVDRCSGKDPGIKKKIKTPLKKIVTLRDLPAVDDTDDAGENNDVISWEIVSSLKELPVDRHLHWCKICNNAGKKTCKQCTGMQIIKVITKGGAVDWQLAPPE